VKIFATSGGFLPTDRGAFQWRTGPIIDHAIELAGSPARPRLCFIGTATGDSLNGTAGFYRAFAGSDVRASHLELFTLPNVPDIRAHLLAQDVVPGMAAIREVADRIEEMVADDFWTLPKYSEMLFLN
jgi:hypothetical protein